MKMVLELLGRLTEWVRGPFTTTLATEQDPVNQVFRLQSQKANSPMRVYVESYRLMYKTRYRRGWIPNTCRCVYVVRGHADGLDDQQLPDDFFQPQTFPCLSGWLLRWTTRPHLYAIHAFMDQFLSRYQGILLA